MNPVKIQFLQLRMKIALEMATRGRYKLNNFTDSIVNYFLSVCLSGFCVVLHLMSTNYGKLRWTTALKEAERDSTS